MDNFSSHKNQENQLSPQLLGSQFEKQKRLYQEYGTPHNSSDNSSQSTITRATISAESEQVTRQLYLIYESFCRFGNRQEVQGQMDGSKFSKLCKDCNLTNKFFSSTDVDIIFAKVKGKGQRKIEWEQFINALELIALKQDMSLEETVYIITDSSGPVSQGTRAQYNKLHDDKSQYTGVYARGGPTNYDPDANTRFVKVLQKQIPYGSLALTPLSQQQRQKSLQIGGSSSNTSSSNYSSVTPDRSQSTREMEDLYQKSPQGLEHPTRQPLQHLQNQQVGLNQNSGKKDSKAVFGNTNSRNSMTNGYQKPNVLNKQESAKYGQREEHSTPRLSQRSFTNRTS